MPFRNVVAVWVAVLSLVFPALTIAAQPRDLLAVDSGEQAHAAVGLLLSVQGKVVLGNIDEEFTQQLSQRGKRHSATDA